MQPDRAPDSGVGENGVIPRACGVEGGAGRGGSRGDHSFARKAITLFAPGGARLTGRLKPLSDAWLFWDAERLEAYPHSDSGPEACEDSVTESDAADPPGPLRLRLFEHLLVYVAGIASALVGMGLAVMLGSFVHAYGVLSAVNQGATNPVVDYPSLNVALLADAAAAAGDTEVAAPSASPPAGSDHVTAGQGP